VSRHALEVLEFPSVLDRVARRASSELARERLRRLTPGADLEDIRRELARVGTAMVFVQEKPSWGMPPVPDLRPALRQLSVRGALLEPLQLHRAAELLGAAGSLAAELDGRAEDYPELRSIRVRLVEEKELEERLHRTVDAEGNVLDTASRELRRIRGRLRGAQARIVKKLEAFMGSLPERFVVPDASVTLREGRYVIPVRREGKGEVGGIGLCHHDHARGVAVEAVDNPRP